jgi:hypothetical protein
MTRGEIKGLQELAMAHGGSLTINPETGLAEAGFLKNILPMVAGAALAATGIGAPMAALMVGGFEGVRTGDIGKGLTAGLGAFGGAGMAGMAGLGSAGASTAGATTGSAAGSATGSTAAGTTAGAGSSLTPTANAITAGPATSSASVIPTASSAPVSTSNILASQPVSAGSVGINPASGSYGIGNMGAANTGIGLTAGPAPVSTAGVGSSNIPATAGNIAKYGIAAAAPAMAAASEVKPPVQEEEYDGPLARYSLSKDFKGYTPPRPMPYRRPEGLGYTGYAEGGMVDPMQQMPNGGLAGIQGMRDGYAPSMTRYGEMPQFAEGGALRVPRMKDVTFKDTNPNTANLDAYEAAQYYAKNISKKNKVPYSKAPKTSVESLGDIEVGPVKQAATGGSIGGYSDGGRMLKGPGDGMSDSIPGVIGNKQPARLADGEFVVPADVVSHLGNGSTDAGAKRLYAMMDKVRHARTGNKKQGKKIKPEKYMPA